MAGDFRHFRTTKVLKDGTRVTVRAVRGDDRPRIVAAFHKLERETVYSRFFAFKNALSDADLNWIAKVDFANELMLVVTLGEDGDEIVIGAGSYNVYHGADGDAAAEVAFIVEEDYQGLGIARCLLAHLTRMARRQGVVRFEAEVLAENRSILGVFKGSGLPMRHRLEGGVVYLTLDLRQGDRPRAESA